MMGLLMARYLASQIEGLKLKYSDVIEKYPEEKEEIDKLLYEDGMDNLIEK